MDTNWDIQIRIPGIIPAKKNRMRVGRGRVYKDKSVVEAEALIKTQSQLGMAYAGEEIITGPVAIEVVCYYDDRRRRDSHNVLGSLLDAMEGIVYLNDTQVVDCLVSKRLCEKGNAETFVNVWKLEEKPNYYPLKKQ